MTEPRLQSLLAEIHEWGRVHDEREQDPNRKMRNLMPETARLVSILVRGGRHTRMLEVGTSSGYSTIWLAWCARALNGRVMSIDHSAEKLALAAANLRRAGLDAFVDLRCGDASEVVSSLPGPFDFVFFDSVQVRPHLQLAPLLPKLTGNALLLADNVLSHPEGMAPFLAIIDAQPDFARAVIPVGKGLCVAQRLGSPWPGYAPADRLAPVALAGPC
jgi:predicted O-methyltransferase YrrM